MKRIYGISDNPQQRVWTGVLYPDNDNHSFAIDMLIGTRNSILMLHDQDISKKGEPVKPHYHFIMQYDNPYYKKKLVIKDLDLDWEENWHLILSLQEIEYKRVDDYIVYLTHVKFKDKHYYSPDLFTGGMSSYAINVCKNEIDADDVNMMEILNYLEKIQFSDHNFRYKSLKMIYETLYKKFGSIVYKKWNFIRQFVQDYRGNL